jgi:uncharacterized protein
MNAIYLNDVIHDRRIPKPYKFNFRFFWYYLNIKDLHKLHNSSKLFSYNKFNLFSFYDKDHLPINNLSIEEKVKTYLLENNIEEDVEDIFLLTNLRFLGYVFNPVSFYFIKTNQGQQYSIIEIGNTFKEIKPIFVDSSHYEDFVFDKKVTKHFYISPFAALNNEMRFIYHIPNEKLKFIILDSKQNLELELTTSLKGVRKDFNDKELFKAALSKPFATLQVIFFIHWHALKLFLKKVPYIKKNDNPELQRGYYPWKS